VSIKIIINYQNTLRGNVPLDLPQDETTCAMPPLCTPWCNSDFALALVASRLNTTSHLHVGGQALGGGQAHTALVGAHAELGRHEVVHIVGVCGTVLIELQQGTTWSSCRFRPRLLVLFMTHEAGWPPPPCLHHQA
jgi:hypothetical protein